MGTKKVAVAGKDSELVALFNEKIKAAGDDSKALQVVLVELFDSLKEHEVLIIKAEDAYTELEVANGLNLKEVERLDAFNKQYLIDIKDLHAESVELKATIARLEGNAVGLSDYNTKVANLTAENAALLGKIADKDNNLESAEKLIDELQAENEKLKKGDKNYRPEVTIGERTFRIVHGVNLGGKVKSIEDIANDQALIQELIESESSAIKEIFN